MTPLAPDLTGKNFLVVMTLVFEFMDDNYKRQAKKMQKAVDKVAG